MYSGVLGDPMMASSMAKAETTHNQVALIRSSRFSVQYWATCGITEMKAASK